MHGQWCEIGHNPLSTSSPRIITAAEVTPPSHCAFLAVRPYSTEYATRTTTDPTYIRAINQALQAQGS